MATGRPWQTLIMLHKAKKDGLLRRLSLIQTRLDHATDLEARLERYQEETVQGFREGVLGARVSASFLQGSVDFYDRLDKGKVVQSAEIAKLAQLKDEVLREIVSCNMEIMKFEKLIQKDGMAELKRMSVAEQKATDNFVNAAVARNLLIENKKGD